MSRTKLRHILADEGLVRTASVQSEIITWAREGNRVRVGGKNIWAGLGNRAGLHGYAMTAINDKWRKSGPRFEKKIDGLPEGTKVELLYFKPTSRERGRWVVDKTVTIPAQVGGGKMPSALLRAAVNDISDIDQGERYTAQKAEPFVGKHPYWSGKVWKIWIRGTEYHWAEGQGYNAEYYLPDEDEAYGL